MVALLALSFHPAFYPPKSGGEQRLYHIYDNLSKKFDIMLISFTYPNSEGKIEVVEHNERFKERRIPKTRASTIMHCIVERFSNIQECSAVITSIESRFNNNFKSIVMDEVAKADIVVFVHPYLFTMPEELLKGKKVVYESYNVEYDLMKQSLSGSFIGDILLKYVSQIEGSLARRSNLIFAVSEENKDTLANTYSIKQDKIELSYNGINSEDYNDFAKEKKRGHRARCVFVGSFHPPNIEAIENIVKIATHMPDTDFLVAGSAAQYYLNHASDLLEQENSDIVLSRRDIIINGLYNTELWDSTPTAWSKPGFRVLASERIENIMLRLYSPLSQRIDVEFETWTEPFNLAKGFNYLSIPLKVGEKKALSFKCEKIYADRERKLGIALQNLVYYKEGKEFSLDITQCIRPLYVFKEARNVLLLGQISDAEKQELYRISDLSLNPMASGSGTNIKMLDYMAAGLPVVTTHVGARGLGLENYCHAVICDIHEFPEKIQEIIDNGELYQRLKDNGCKLVKEKYDWRKIAEDMAETLEKNLL